MQQDDHSNSNSYNSINSNSVVVSGASALMSVQSMSMNKRVNVEKCKYLFYYWLSQTKYHSCEKLRIDIQLLTTNNALLEQKLVDVLCIATTKIR